jgi:hypothetical protein
MPVHRAARDRQKYTTQNQPKIPWITAQRVECHFDHEIVMASALPKLMPVEATVFLVLMCRSIRR